VNEAVDPDSPIGREARAWALAVFGEPFPPERAEELRRWLAADPRHALAYEQAESLMMALGGVEALRARPARNWRVPALGLGAALAASLVAGVLLTSPPAPIDAGPSVRVVALKDGSVATLAPGARVRAASRWTNRQYVLEQGQAFFDVRHARNHRFQVTAGDARIEVLGTRFDARLGQSGQVQVAVERGLVAVYHTPARSPRRLAAKLGAGDYLLLASGRALAGKMAAGEPIGGWRTGRLAYADAPLGDVIADINGYGRTRLRASPAAAGLRVTASFEIGQSERFVANLPKILPVAVEPAADGTRTITVRAKPVTTGP
jgi:transmembrane sensor